MTNTKYTSNGLQTRKNIKWCDLTGPEKHRLFQTINIPELFPEISNAKDIQQAWNNFYER